MAFNGLEDRFLASASKIYHKYSTKDGSPDGLPFVEIKPDAPNARETAHDSRLVPFGSIRRDFTRIGKYLRSNDGLLFLAEQEVLQFGNTFTETRLINPLFVISNVQPYVHFRRSFAIASNQTPNGDFSHKSPGSDELVGAAGRLQKLSAKNAIQRVVGQSSAGSLLSLLPRNAITDIISTVLEVKDIGIEGIDERPELNVNGQYFSVLMWKGFSKRHNFVSDAKAIINNLTSGNLVGAIKGIGRFSNDLKNDAKKVKGQVNGNQIDGRNDIFGGMEGRRYFITGANNADRYLKDSILITIDPFGREVPIAHVGFLDRKPYSLNGPKDVMPTKSLQSVEQKLNAYSTGLSRVTKNVTSFIRNPVPSFLNLLPKKNTLTNLLAAGAKDVLSGKLDPTDNPGQNAMLFAGVSLEARYEDGRFAYIQNSIKSQKDSQTEYWNSLNDNIGFVGGLKAGEDIQIDPKIRGKTRRYFHDNMNSMGVLDGHGTDTSIPDSLVNDIASKAGQDLINVFFYDFVNKKTIPFRALVANVRENIEPEFHDTRYIGRIERNVVYLGAQRELTFQLYVYAFSESEMDIIWEKINYVTGLCFPANYEGNGFIVPPFIKLTMGDFYRDQPGYLRGVSYDIEDSTPWNIDPGSQVPFGITMNIAFTVIEKTQVRAGSMFYPTGQSRHAQPPIKNPLAPSFSPKKFSLPD
jgi:hypothetical protein